MPGALTHARITWSLSPMVPQVPGVTPGPPCAYGVVGTPHGEVRDNVSRSLPPKPRRNERWGFVNDTDQRDWADYVGLAEFSYNAATHSATKQSLFKVAYGVDPLQPADLALVGAHLTLEFNQDVEDLAKKREQVLEKTKLLLGKVQKRYEKQVNAGRREVEYEVGQNVLLNVKNFTMPKLLTPKFMSKFAGLFSIVERVFKDVYKLELPPVIKVHPTFNVSLLKPLNENTLWPNDKQVIRPPPDLLGDHLEYKVEGILKCRNHKRKMNTW